MSNAVACSDARSAPQGFTEEELREFWLRTIDPTNIGPAEAIAADLASFTGESVADVLLKMNDGFHEFRRLWEDSAVDVSDARSVTAFYREQFTEAYELAQWHCGRLDGGLPLGYAHAALFARSRGLRQVLDFGSGIGSGSICFARAGCEVHSADIARNLLRLVEHRMKRHGHQPRLIDLESTTPPLGSFDLITAFDVLEHVPDQYATLSQLESYLRVGGYLFTNLTDDSSDEDRPMHISSAGNRLRLIRRTSLVPDWANFHGMSQVYVRQRNGRLRNLAASWIDRFQGV